MSKIELEDFFRQWEDNKIKLAIHCKTRKQAIKLLKEFNKLGKSWFNGDSYLVNYWGLYKENTCYNNQGYCYGINHCTKNHAKVYEFDDIIFDDDKEQHVKIKENKDLIIIFKDGVIGFVKNNCMCDRCVERGSPELEIRDLFSGEYIDNFTLEDLFENSNIKKLTTLKEIINKINDMRQDNIKL